MTRTLFVLSAMLASAAPAHAYLDPGTGSLLLQGAIATLAALFGMLSLWWHQAKQFVGSYFKPAATAAEANQAHKDGQ